MSLNNLRILQSICIFLQIANAEIATLHVPTWLPVLLAAALGGLQFYAHATAANIDPRSFYIGNQNDQAGMAGVKSPNTQTVPMTKPIPDPAHGPDEI